MAEDLRSLGSKWLNLDTSDILKNNASADPWQRYLWSRFGAGENIVVHRGFKAVYTRSSANSDRNNDQDSIQLRLRSVIDNLGSKIKKITVTGHSLGAAASVVCGLDLGQYLERKNLLSQQPGDDKAELQIVTFACPMTADDKLGKEFRRFSALPAAGRHRSLCHHRQIFAR